MTSPEENTRLLADFVELYRVCWEVWPEYIALNGEKRQIGFVLELVGTHEPGVEHPTPGCDHCLRVFGALQAIAEYILPKETRPSRYEIEVYDQAIRYSPKRRNRPDVILQIKILHRQGFERPLDECEIRCLTEMKQRLRDLGACEAQWSSRMETRR
ncbi:MAG: hypothetical protein HY649_04355 [Acidobacteria bacterium]|nr:hypothetical protein [Acidobacteriota bacterium]